MRVSPIFALTVKHRRCAMLNMNSIMLYLCHFILRRLPHWARGAGAMQGIEIKQDFPIADENGTPYIKGRLAYLEIWKKRNRDALHAHIFYETLNELSTFNFLFLKYIT